MTNTKFDDNMSASNAHEVQKTRMAENQVVFRKGNEKLLKGFDELVQVAKEDGLTHFIPSTDALDLHFYCECSDENCRDSIVISFAKYHSIHRKRNRFVVLPGHEVDEIEKITEKHDKYIVVEKYKIPRQNVTELSPTAVDNSAA